MKTDRTHEYDAQIAERMMELNDHCPDDGLNQLRMDAMRDMLETEEDEAFIDYLRRSLAAASGDRSTRS